MYIDVSNTKPWFSCRHLLVFFVWTWPIKLNYRKCICQKPKLTKLLYRKCIFLDTYGCAPQSIPQNPCPGLCLLRPCLDSHAKTSCCPTTSCAFDLLGDSSWIRHRPSKSSQNMPKMSVFKRMMMLNIIFNILKNHEKKTYSSYSWSCFISFRRTHGLARFSFFETLSCWSPRCPIKINISCLVAKP